MSFKIRRVVSGLLPLEHVTEVNHSSRSNDFSDNGSPGLKGPQVRRLSDLDDFADRDLPVGRDLSGYGNRSVDRIHSFDRNHPADRNHSFDQNRSVERNPYVDKNQSFPDEEKKSFENLVTSGYTRKTSNISSIPSNSAGSAHKRGSSADARKGGYSFQSEQIINNHNEFRPLVSLQNGSRINLGIKPRVEQMEFDSSDQSLPLKLAKPFRLDSQLSAPRLPFLPELALSDGIPKNNASEPSGAFEQTHPVSYTPRRLSPLRKEVRPSSHNGSTTGDLVEEIKQSSALRSRSTQEILDQINSSMDRIRANETPQRSSSDTSSDSDELESGAESPEDELPDNDIRLQGLSDFVPQQVLENIRETRSQAASPAPVATDPSFPLVNTDPTFPRASTDPLFLRSHLPVGEELCRTRKRPLHTIPREKSTKKVKAASYGAWLFEKWDKLKRLVELPIPNSVIINNAIVMKELGCQNEQELQQRVEFLRRNTTR